MRTEVGVASSLIAWALAASAAVAAPMQIQFAEAVSLPAVEGKAELDAYGRRFALTLETNDRLLNAVGSVRKIELGQSRVLRGKVDGVPDSWVRLTRVGNAVEGAIWDGNELYVVASYDSIVGKLTTPLVVAPDQTVVYRLSDTLGGLSPEFCGLAGDVVAEAETPGSALQQYKGIVTELRASAAAAVTDQIDISLIADTEFQNLFGVNAVEAMLARLNVVDGIFAEQVGVVLMPTEFRLVSAGANPFTTTDANGLLEQVAAFRESTPVVRGAGLAHLMTGKNLNGNTLGIAYIDSLCRAREGVSVGNSDEGALLSALVMAHELGHNFGARHDAVPGVCAATPLGLLMSPELNGSTQFSACSLNSMAASIAAARGVCIAPPQRVDLALILPASPFTAQTNGTFSLPITVRSVGNLAVTNVNLRVTFPAWFSMQSATLTGATCSTTLSTISCALGDFTAGQETVLDLRITGSSIGIFTVQAEVTADLDFSTSNNTGQVQVGIESGVDLGVTAATSATSVFVTDAVDYTFDVTSSGPQPSHGGTASINIGGIPIESFNAGPHSCAITSSNWILFCTLADIAAGASTRITVRGRPGQARIANGIVELNVQNDSSATNDSARFSVTVSKQEEVRTRVSAEELRAVIGTTYELTYTLTTLGRTPAQNVRFSLQQAPAAVFESVVTSVTCVPATDFTTCDFGTLNPGDVRTIVVRFRMTASFGAFMNGVSSWGNRTGDEVSGAFTRVYSNLMIDVAAATSNFFPIDEGVTGEAAFNVETKGVNPAQNVTATLELAPPLRLLSLTYSNGPAGWTCTVLTPQRGRCTGSFTGGALFTDLFAVMRYTFVSDTAGDGLATIAVSAADDGDPTNNSAQLTLPIRPYLDVAITGANQSRVLISGETTTLDATLTTGNRPVPAVQVRPWANSLPLVLDSFSVGGVAVDCSQTQSGTNCDLGDLPANSSLPVRAVFRALPGEANVAAIIIVQTPRDSNGANNQLTVQIQTVGLGDVGVSVAQPSVTGVNGTTLQFPLITVTNGAATTRDLTLEIPLPPFVTVSSVSASFIACSGTTTVQCTLTALAPNDSRTIAIALNATGTGTFTSNVVLRAFNDSSAANNTAAVAFTVNAPAPVPAPPSGGGSSSGGGASGGKSGGGGRFEWLALAMLGGMVWRRRIKGDRSI